ncbi:MAG TPA: MipA/OmpV family protein [Holophagaceae bacterium]|nr:MipA/OmpV family protein [Holophagaceae bacterium]
MRLRALGSLCLLATLRADDPGAIAGLHSHDGSGDWSVSLGLAPLSFPKYLGADRNRFVAFPLLDVEYRHRVYLGSSRLGVGLGQGLGVYAVRTPVWRWSFDLDVTDRRPENRGDALAGLGDRPRGLFLGSSVMRQWGGLTATLGVAHGLKDDAGTLGVLRVEWSGDLGGDGWFWSLGAAARYGDARNLAYDFGVGPDQAAARTALVAAGDPRLTAAEVGPYLPGAGLRDLSASGSLGHRLGERLRVFAFGNASFLQAQARRSPLVKGDVNFVAGAGFSYRF